jgi:hypothetical protein
VNSGQDRSVFENIKKGDLGESAPAGCFHKPLQYAQGQSDAGTAAVAAKNFSGRGLEGGHWSVSTDFQSRRIGLFWKKSTYQNITESRCYLVKIDLGIMSLTLTRLSRLGNRWTYSYFCLELNLLTYTCVCTFSLCLS